MPTKQVISGCHDFTKALNTVEIMNPLQFNIFTQGFTDLEI